MSTPKFHTLSIADIRQETEDCVSVAFAIPADLKNDYQYSAGQYITLKTTINGEEIRRSYSICSAPDDGELRVAIKQIPDGRFSTFANKQLKKGDKIEVMTPMGNFVLDNNPKHVHYYGFAGGSGITPIVSIVKTVLAQNENNTFTLVYSNRNLASIIFREEIEALKNKYVHRFKLVHLLSRERLEADINYGRLNKEKCTDLFKCILNKEHIDEAFICGPEQMIIEVKEYLLENGVDAKKVKFELFGTAIAKAESKEINTANEGKVSKVSIKVDDRTMEIDLPFNGATILDAALKNGADLPYACKGGVCCTCRAKIIEGEVSMDVNYALEPDEVAAGFVLTCQAHPLSEKVVVDFDVR